MRACPGIETRAKIMRGWLAVLLACFALGATDALARLHDGNPSKGERIFRTYAGCHSLKPRENRIGPSLAGLFGRIAGTASGFRYSSALRESDVVWDEETLEVWLANPRKFIPGIRMAYSGLRKARWRADRIAILKKATRP